MESRPLRVYADTSVFGGVLDSEFARASQRLFELVRRRKLILVTSALVEEELAGAPPAVQELFEHFSPLAEVVPIGANALRLRAAYVQAGIVTQKSADDALHVALATVNTCPVLVSWNCRHIVNFRRIPRYNAVNRLHGYPEVAIHTPHEVVGDEGKDVRLRSDETRG